VDRKDLQALSRIRMNEAKGLLGLGLYDGAYYLAGYAVECALKACIAKKTNRHEFPDKKRADSSHTHSLSDLVRVANLEAARQELARSDPEFKENWDTVKLWSEQSRYGRHSAEAAEDLVEAVCNRRHGVVAWIRLHW
jgi:HEPN domain-containing protein